MSSPPLSFAVLRQRYPHLYTQIAHMSEREKSVQDCLLEGKGGKGGGEPCLPLDAETGLCSTIMCIDFTAPLSKQEGCPMAVDSDANKCSMFMWRALQVRDRFQPNFDTRADLLHFSHILHRLPRADRWGETRADSTTFFRHT